MTAQCDCHSERSEESRTGCCLLPRPSGRGPKTQLHFFIAAGFQPHTQRGHARGMSLQQWCRDTAPPCPHGCRIGVRRNSLHGGVTAHAVTQTECSVCSCCYFLWKKVTKELCEILTHDALPTPRAESFGGVEARQSHRVLHVHRNFTPSSASAHRTPPKISRAWVFVAVHVRVVEWSTTPQRRRSSGSSTDTGYSSGVDAGTFPLRVLRATSWTKTAGRESGATAYTGASRPTP
jgi:hypothetical protein